MDAEGCGAVLDSAKHDLTGFGVLGLRTSISALLTTSRPAAFCLMQGVTFACVNAAAPGEEGGAGEGDAASGAAAAGAAAAGEPKLATFALRIKMGEVLDQFVAAVNAHKAGGAGGGKKAEVAA